MNRIAAPTLSGLAIALGLAPLTAQAPVDPEAQRIFETALEKRYERWATVDNYTVVRTFNGAEQTQYYEKVLVDGMPAFRLVPPHEYESKELEEALGGGMGMPADGGIPSGGAAASGAAASRPSSSGAGESRGGIPTGGTELPGGAMPQLPELPVDIPLPENLPELPEELEQVAGAVSNLRDRIREASEAVGSARGAARDASNMASGGGVPGGGGGGLGGAAGSALGMAAGGAQQQLMQKGMEGLMSLVESQGDGSEDAQNDARSERMMFEELGRRTRLTGTEVVDGAECFVLVAEDLEGLDLGAATGEDANFALKTITSWIDTEDYVPRRTLMEGEIEMEGEPIPIGFEMVDQDYRRVETMYEPHHRVISSTGMMDAMMAALSPKEKEEMRQAVEQLDEMEKQMSQIPAAQREMIMSQMGPQIEQLRKIAEGTAEEAPDMVMETLDMRVNEGPPTLLGRGDLVVEGDVALELERVLATVGTGPHPEGDGTLSAVQFVGGLEGELTMFLQVNIEGEFPDAGTAEGNGVVAFAWADGSNAALQAAEGTMTLTITSRTSLRITGEFSFQATGERQAEGERIEIAGEVRGTFDAPIPTAVPGLDAMGMPQGMPPQRPPP